MLYRIIPFLLLCLHYSRSNESTFKPVQCNPKLGEDVLLFCKLKAPHGHNFSGITPDLTTNDVDHQFNFNDIQMELGDSRYNGFEIPDLTSTELQGIILISPLLESDLSRQFTCFRSLFGSDNKTSVTLALGTIVHTTATTTTTTFTNTSEQTPTTEVDTTTHSPLPTTVTINAATHPTHTTPTPVVESTNCPQQPPINWKQIFTTVAIMVVIFLVCKIPCFIVCLYKVRRWAKEKFRPSLSVKYTVEKTELTLEPKNSQKDTEDGVINLTED